MFWIILLLNFYIPPCIPQESDGLKDCSNVTSSSLTICKLEHDYHPGAVPEPKPLKVQMQIRILNIVDLNWEENSMTIFVQLMTLWNDSRITVKSGAENKYVIS